MNCPNCGTPNDPSSRFCIKCGQSLAEASTVPTPPLARPSPSPLIIFSIRLVVALLVVWLLRSALLRLPFTQGIGLTTYVPVLSADMRVNLRSGQNWDAQIGIVVHPLQAQALSGLLESALNRLVSQIQSGGGEANWTRQDQTSDGNVEYRISAASQGLDRLYSAFFGSQPALTVERPSGAEQVVFRLPSDLPLSVSEIITSIAYIIILVLLVTYAQALWSMWPQAFPRAVGFTPTLVAILYVIGLVTLYLALAKPLLVLTEEPVIIVAFQVVLLVIAAILLGWAGMAAYNYLPIWMAGLRFEVPPAAQTVAACPHCGQWNPAAMKFCGHCGKPLTSQSAVQAGAASL